MGLVYYVISKCPVRIWQKTVFSSAVETVLLTSGRTFWKLCVSTLFKLQQYTEGESCQAEDRVVSFWGCNTNQSCRASFVVTFVLSPRTPHFLCFMCLLYSYRSFGPGAKQPVTLLLVEQVLKSLFFTVNDKQTIFHVKYKKMYLQIEKLQL